MFNFLDSTASVLQKISGVRGFLCSEFGALGF